MIINIFKKAVFSICILSSFNGLADIARVATYFSNGNISKTVIENKFQLQFGSYRTIQINESILIDQLYPLYDLGFNKSNSMIIELPMPNGSNELFKISAVQTMEIGLSLKYPTIKTFRIQGISNPLAYGSVELSYLGFSAMIISGEKEYFIQAVDAQLGNYISVAKEAMAGFSDWICDFNESNLDLNNLAKENKINTTGPTLRTYRLALACTGEYTSAKGGTKAKALSGMITTINRVNAVYEVELAIHLNLISNTDTLIYLNATTDPYSNNAGGTMLGENQSNIDLIIQNANYDMGHVFSTGGGGIAGFGVVCRSGQKAKGVTGSPSPTGDSFDIDFVAHEMGHQFGASHTFNSTNGGCGGGNRENSSAYEPGSGLTIMAYAGLCGADNISAKSIPFFHTFSFDQIVSYSQSGSGSACAVQTNTGNNAPIAINSLGYILPKGTPFKLSGNGTDLDGDQLKFSFEQFDLGPFGGPDAPTGNAPLFRNFPPDTLNYRIFPKIGDIVFNKHTKGELLPSYSRSMNFRLVVRDNKVGGGGVSYADAVEMFVDTAGPFLISNFNIKGTIGTANTQTLQWSVNNTDVDPINCKFVNIFFSRDGGFTFPDTLAMNVPNNGKAQVNLFGITTIKGRFKVEAVGNIFFDISNNDLTSDPTSGLLFNSLDEEDLFEIYPNPTIENFNIKINREFQSNYTVTIINTLGQIVSVHNYKNIDKGNILSIPTNGLEKGFYILNLLNGKDVLAKKSVIIQ